MEEKNNCRNKSKFIYKKFYLVYIIKKVDIKFSAHNVFLE
jgi:hypothetical protein